MGIFETFKNLFQKEALIAALTALFLAGGGGRWIKSFFYRPKIEVSGYAPFKQADNLKVWRLSLKNTGNDIAYNVQANTISIFDKGEERRNFLPIPLRWTHLNQLQMDRNILPGQTVYLDIFEDVSNDLNEEDSLIPSHTIRLASEFGTNIPDFTYLYPKTTLFEIAIFHSRMKPIKLVFYPRISLDDKSTIASMTGRFEKIKMGLNKIPTELSRHNPLHPLPHYLQPIATFEPF